jgi:hypothetical protein
MSVQIILSQKNRAEKAGRWPNRAVADLIDCPD